MTQHGFPSTASTPADYAEHKCMNNLEGALIKQSNLVRTDALICVHALTNQCIHALSLWCSYELQSLWLLKPNWVVAHLNPKVDLLLVSR